MPLDEAKLAELQSQSKTKIHVIKVGEKEIVLRQLDRMEYRKFKSDKDDERKRLDLAELLVMGHLVYPSAAEFEALLEDKPALVDILGAQLLSIAGLGESVEKKEL
jgi:hypothetical protein